MAGIWRRFVDLVFSIGAHLGEDDLQRTKRRIFVVAAISATLLTISKALELGSSGQPLAAASLWVVIAAAPLALVIVHLKPGWFPRVRCDLEASRNANRSKSKDRF